MQVTRYQCILGSALAAALLAGFGLTGVASLGTLGLIGAVTGVSVGMGVAFPQWQIFGQSVCRVRTQRRAVALTFDDGPDPQNTQALLALLAKRNIRATFFCIGKNVAAHPEVARRIVTEGHAIENHSFQHHLWTNLFSVDRLVEDISKSQEEIRRATGVTPLFYRPPVCLTNPRVFRAVNRLHLRVAGYTTRGLDRRADPPAVIADRLLRRLAPGSVFLLHDRGVPAEKMLAVVTLLLDNLEANGYQCVRLDELVSLENQ